MEGLDFVMGDYEGQLHIFSKTEMFIFFLILSRPCWGRGGFRVTSQGKVRFDLHHSRRRKECLLCRMYV